MWALIGRKHLCSEKLRGVSAPAPKSRGGGESRPTTKVAYPEKLEPAPTDGAIVGVASAPRDSKLKEPSLTKVPMTDREAARYIVQTHPVTQQADEKPEDFVLRIVRAYDHVKGGMIHRTKPRGRPLEKDRAKSLEATRPWEAEGMSRRTWFRRKGKS